MKCYLDGYRFDGEKLSLTGWAVPETGNARLSYAVRVNGRELPDATVLLRRRPDISTEYLSNPYREDAAFFMEFSYEGREKAVLVVTEEENGAVKEKREIPVSLPALKKRQSLRALKKRLNGPLAFAGKVKNKLLHTEAKAYHEWFLRQEENGESPSVPASDPEHPLFSIVVPVYRTPVRVLNELADSVFRQTFPEYELILANASTDDEELEKALKSLSERDRRVKVLPLSENGGIARNTNEAASSAKGVFLCFLDHDDLLSPGALKTFSEAYALHPDADVLYSDEDKVTDDSSLYYDPNFKPDFDPVLLSVSQYVCHFTAVRRSLFAEAGGLSPAYDGAQDHDLLLRLSERTDRFFHVPKVLYHWRSTPDSTASGREKKTYAEDAGCRAVNAHFKRLDLPLSVTEGPQEGRYVLCEQLVNKPLVSVLIANRDHASDLNRIVTALFETATYRNLEVLILENGSREEETFALYEALKKEHPSVRVLTMPGDPFNYAKLHNDAVGEAKGEYLLLLNNDTDVLTPGFLEHMVAVSEIPDVGAVGAKLLYPDRTVQHAGIVTGEGGIAFHPFKRLRVDEPGYMCRAVTPMTVSAVTGACLLIRKADYEAVGGMDEQLAVALNDVDLCFKLREKGRRVVIDTEAKLFHLESRSRGMEETKEKFLRYGAELQYFGEKWKGSGLFPDPYYPGVFSLLYGYEIKRG